MKRFYSALLHLYPASFRAEYGGEMRAIFAARLRETRGWSSRFMLSVNVTLDVLVNAAAVHADILRHDLRYTARTLARSPGFALTAVVVTALGIGANTAAFSIADFVFLRPLPYADADRLVKLWQASPGVRNQASPPIYADWKASSRSFEAMGAYFGIGANLVGQGDPQRLECSAVTADLLPILGVQPLLGRLFNPAEAREGATGPLVLSYGVWRAQFGGDPTIIGRQVLLDGNPRPVIGVMPREFHFPHRDVALWRLMTPEEQGEEDVSNTYWEVLAKLRPAVTREQAGAEMDVISRRLQQRYPGEQEDTGVFINPLRQELSNQSRLLLIALCGAAGCVLLIACANLANLLLARALTRRKEILVRAALGAGRERLVRQSMTESLVLALLGGALGVGVAYVALPLLTRLVPHALPIAESPSIDPRVLVFAGVLTAVTGIAFGVLPAWKAAGQLDLSGLGHGARVGGGPRERARSVLVVAEVTASVVLLVSTGLLMRTLLHLQGLETGLNTENVLTLRTALPMPKYEKGAARAAFYRDVLAGIRVLPGVSSAAYITSLPIANVGGIWPVTPEGQEPAARPERASSRFVTPGYFASLGIPLRRGRDVGDDDEIERPWVAVVSESFVERYWPNEDPIGKRFKFLNDVRTVIGVVGDVRMRGLEQPSEPQVYLGYKQVRDGQSEVFAPKDLVIRSSSPAKTVVPAVRHIVRRVDAQQPISNVRPMSEIVSDATAARAVQVRVLTAFAAIAFLLAAIGIHGLLSFTVSSRQHEIGVRMALGAQRSEIVRLIVRRGVLLAAAGVLPGIAIAYAAGRTMQSLLSGVQPADPVTFVAAGLLCVMMTVIGSFQPAMRAVRVDPATAFRVEA